MTDSAENGVPVFAKVREPENPASPDQPEGFLIFFVCTMISLKTSFGPHPKEQGNQEET